MGVVRETPSDDVSFRCQECRLSFKAAPGRIDDVPGQDWHPWRYFAACPECGCEAEQAWWERNLMKAHARATGPRSEAGRAASAANLDGHPTPEEALRTRFNSMKHGLYARVATYFPARPGRYPHCDGCGYLDECAGQVACLRRTELFLKHQIAFETRDPGMLTELRSDTQAAVQGLINDMLLAIAQDGGPRIHELQWFYDKDGGFHLAQYTDDQGTKHQITEVKAHPLLRPLIDFLAKNSMTLADLEMTPKALDDQEMMRGYLEDKRAGQDSLDDFRQRQEDGLALLRKLIGNSQGAQRDPVVIDGEVDDG